ncbi:ankyrin repeat domain-containing protein [Wolbachia endosymbiont of Pentalonia nigronervosa]|uniref:ankyrin repeat domain-containing protein n=1 Tax=Wolbachia endosymbiont of Pentalonia nigronervosa TaxID=1301914 RepID=UPI00165FE5E8|nr:ankyrin repeat domain-containing protein [Wolbachia endosymbiont of Pentalonia nigronervosa]MBD0391770.1 ankyrin repeat domain-containing protein [Wolbachia endosymbiont of Pentalonia nigronervosa]
MSTKKTLQDFNSRDKLSKENAIEMASKPVPSTSKVTIEVTMEMTVERELQNLNNNPDLNENNVVKMMSKFIPSAPDVNYRHPYIIDLNSYIFAQGCTLLHIAAALNCDKIADFLIRKGADVDSRNYDECTPLHYAAMYGSTEAAKVLIAAKANINTQDFFKKPPLQYACERGYTEVTRILIDNDADRSCFHTYIAEKSIGDGEVMATIAGFIATAITPIVLSQTTELSKYAIMGATVASALMVGGIASGFKYIRAKHERNSKLDEVECDDATPLSPQPA